MQDLEAMEERCEKSQSGLATGCDSNHSVSGKSAVKGAVVAKGSGIKRK